MGSINFRQIIFVIVTVVAFWLYITSSFYQSHLAKQNPITFTPAPRVSQTGVYYSEDITRINEEVNRRRISTDQLLKDMVIQTPSLGNCNLTKKYQGRGLSFSYPVGFRIDDEDTSTPIFVGVGQIESMRIEEIYIDQPSTKTDLAKFLAEEFETFHVTNLAYVKSITQINLPSKKLYKIAVVSLGIDSNSQFTEDVSNYYYDLLSLYAPLEKSYKRPEYQKTVEITDNLFYCIIDSVKVI